MRDVKNKICQDCELVALLEDDNGMELLVNNKIISLDLPVREVGTGWFCWGKVCNILGRPLISFSFFTLLFYFFHINLAYQSGSVVE
jgi:hypothetical protein